MKRRNDFDWIRASVGAMTLGALAAAFPVAAQTTAAPEGTTPKSPIDGIEEVVVTAQRRAESAQDVPIAVTAFSAEQLERVGLASTADLPSIVPGLTLNPSAGRSPLTLRGVGNNGYSTSPAVLLFIDGVYQPFDNSGTDFSNIESIELAKGPQGTLFGRNATGGVLQVRTKNPFDWQGLDAQVGYGNYDTVSSKLYASTKFSEQVAADLAGFYENQGEGWGENIVTGRDHFKARRYGVRSKVVSELGDDFTATFTGDYSYRWGQVGHSIASPVGNGTLFNPLTMTSFTLPTPYDISSELSPFWRSREGGGAVTLEKGMGEITLLSISSYRRTDMLIAADFDGTEFDLARVSRHDRRNAITQELQARGGGDSFNWVTGLYYFRLKNDNNGPRLSGLGFPGGLAISSEDKAEAYAAYAQGTVEILPETRLTLGARYTLEDRDITGRTETAGAVNPGSAGKQDARYKEPNYRVALDHRFSPDVLAYASWNHGFNAGFFDQIAFGGFTDATNPEIKPEKIDAYEIGLKTDLLDRHLRVNVAGFWYDYDNLQQQVFGLGGIRTLNAASARIKGVDLDITARPMAALLLSFGATYLDTEYRSYPAAPNYDMLPNGAFLANGARDAKGNRIVNAPKMSLQVSATYTLNTTIGTVDLTANVNRQGDQWTDPQNEFAVEGRTLLGLTGQWRSRNENTSVTLWAKNLTDKEYDLSYNILEPTGRAANPGAPRTYGVTIGQKF